MSATTHVSKGTTSMPSQSDFVPSDVGDDQPLDAKDTPSQQDLEELRSPERLPLLGG